MTAVLTFVLLLVFGILLVFRGRAETKPGDRSNRAPLIIGLVLLGLGGFGILNFWMPGWIAALVTATVMVTVPAGVTRSLSGVMHGIFAVLIIIIIGVVFSLASGGSWLVEAVAAVTESSTEFGKLVTDWVASWT
jgi:hypothetical protein